MSAFTGQGFAPIEPVRTPGSRHTDGLFRSARRAGFSLEMAVRDVYLAGAQAGGLVFLPAAGDASAANVIYLREKTAGRYHGEALDEVFLAGYVAARNGAYTA